MNVCRALLGDYSNAHAYTRCFFSYHQNMSEFDLPLKQMTCDAGTLDIEQQKTHEKTKHPKLAHIWRMLSYPG